MRSLRLLCSLVCRLRCQQQRACQLLNRQRIRTGRDDQLAELFALVGFQLSRLVIERFQLSVIVAGFAHAIILPLWGTNDPVIGVFDQLQCAGMTWDNRVPRQMKSSKGALIRRADVACLV